VLTTPTSPHAVELAADPGARFLTRVAANFTLCISSMIRNLISDSTVAASTPAETKARAFQACKPALKSGHGLRGHGLWKEEYGEGQGEG